MKTWYEVFISDKTGTRTLQICNTINEAKIARKGFLKKENWNNKKLYIDKWENIDNPVCIGEVI